MKELLGVEVLLEWRRQKGDTTRAAWTAGLCVGVVGISKSAEVDGCGKHVSDEKNARIRY
jgi:hypothetical protein